MLNPWQVGNLRRERPLARSPLGIIALLALLAIPLATLANHGPASTPFQPEVEFAFGDPDEDWYGAVGQLVGVAEYDGVVWLATRSELYTLSANRLSLSGPGNVTNDVGPGNYNTDLGWIGGSFFAAQTRDGIGYIQFYSNYQTPTTTITVGQGIIHGVHGERTSISPQHILVLFEDTTVTPTTLEVRVYSEDGLLLNTLPVNYDFADGLGAPLTVGADDQFLFVARSSTGANGDFTVLRRDPHANTYEDAGVIPAPTWVNATGVQFVAQSMSRATPWAPVIYAGRAADGSGATSFAIIPSPVTNAQTYLSPRLMDDRLEEFHLDGGGAFKGIAGNDEFTYILDGGTLRKYTYDWTQVAQRPNIAYEQGYGQGTPGVHGLGIHGDKLYVGLQNSTLEPSGNRTYHNWVRTYNANNLGWTGDHHIIDATSGADDLATYDDHLWGMFKAADQTWSLYKLDPATLAIVATSPLGFLGDFDPVGLAIHNNQLLATHRLGTDLNTRIGVWTWTTPDQGATWDYQGQHRLGIYGLAESPWTVYGTGSIHVRDGGPTNSSILFTMANAPGALGSRVARYALEPPANPGGGQIDTAGFGLFWVCFSAPLLLAALVAVPAGLLGTVAAVTAAGRGKKAKVKRSVTKDAAKTQRLRSIMAIALVIVAAATFLLRRYGIQVC